jgi:hypothetical protein
MHFKLLVLFGGLTVLSQPVLSHSSTAPQAREINPECTFQGNPDFYGIGVRLSFYFQWIAGLISFVLNPHDSENQADIQTLFLLANFIALLVLQVQDAPDINVVVPIILFYIFFGGSVSAIASAITALQSWKKTNLTTKRIALISRQILVQLTFLGLLFYSFYFWTRGLRKFKRFPDECGGTFVFPVAHRVSVDAPSAGSVLVLLLLVLLFLVISLVAYKRLHGNFEWRALVPSKTRRDHFVDQEEIGAPWGKRQL